MQYEIRNWIPAVIQNGFYSKHRLQTKNEKLILQHNKPLKELTTWWKPLSHNGNSAWCSVRLGQGWQSVIFTFMTAKVALFFNNHPSAISQGFGLTAHSCLKLVCMRNYVGRVPPGFPPSLPLPIGYSAHWSLKSVMCCLDPLGSWWVGVVRHACDAFNGYHVLSNCT